MKDNKGFNIILIALVIVVLCIFLDIPQKARYYLFDRGNGYVSGLEFVTIYVGENDAEPIDIYEGADAEDCFHDKNTNTYYIDIDNDLFNYENIEVYTGGHLWNVAAKPEIYVDKTFIGVSDISNTGYQDSFLGETYISKNYRIAWVTKLKKNKRYTITTECDGKTAETKLIFK